MLEPLSYFRKFQLLSFKLDFFENYEVKFKSFKVEKDGAGY